MGDRSGVLAGAAPRWWSAAVGGVLGVLVVAAFWPAFFAQYVSWDDVQNFITNQRWQGLSQEHLRWMFTAFHMGHYQPLTWVSFGLQYAVVGGGPGWSHGVNVALHGVNAWLFYLVVRRMLILTMPGEADHGGSGSRLLTLAAAAGAAFFALHPLRVESVVWVTERRDLLSTTFLLPALLAYLRGVRVGGPGVARRGWYWLAVVLLLLSCASKAWGMSFFVVLMALDVHPLRRVDGLRGWFTRAGARVLIEKAPFVAIGLATAWVASRAVRSVMAAKSLEEWSLADRVVQACYGVVFYLRQTVAPGGHSPLYEVPPALDPWEEKHVVSYVVAAALVAVAVWCWKRARGVTVGLFIYLVQVSPVLGFLQSGDQMVADRYSYLATMPVAVGLGWCVAWVVRRAEFRGGAQAGVRAARLAGGVACGVAAALMGATYAQSTVWHDSRTLWTYAAGVTPTGRVLGYLGYTLKGEDPERARDLYRESLALFPTNGNAWYEYATLSVALRDYKEAERAYVEAARLMPQKYLAHVDLARLLREVGRGEEAMRHFRLAVEAVEQAAPADRLGNPHLLLGLALLEQGRREEAEPHIRAALDYADTREDAAATLRELSRTGP